MVSLLYGFVAENRSFLFFRMARITAFLNAIFSFRCLIQLMEQVPQKRKRRKMLLMMSRLHYQSSILSNVKRKVESFKFLITIVPIVTPRSYEKKNILRKCRGCQRSKWGRTRATTNHTGYSWQRGILKRDRESFTWRSGFFSVHISRGGLFLE